MKKAKYLQVFNYLLEFSKIRSNPVRDIEISESQYPERLWFSNIPQNSCIDLITNADFNEESDFWIKITKPVEPIRPSFPKLSNNLEPWIIKESLDDENSIPKLQSSIIKNGKTFKLIDNANIEKEFQAYLDKQWLQDLFEYQALVKIYEEKLIEYKAVDDVYKQFFRILNKAQQFGEEFELVIGVGLLFFQENNTSPLLRRHMFTSKVEISFEMTAKNSTIKVTPSLESDIQIETDAIIDLFQQFDSNNINNAEELTHEFLKNKEINDYIFDKSFECNFF